MASESKDSGKSTKKYTGTVRIRGARARLQRSRGKSLLLIPYPKNAPLDLDQMLFNGVHLFGFLKNQKATVVGELDGERLYCAMLHGNGEEAAEISARPRLHDELAGRVAKIFPEDSPIIVKRLNSAGIMTSDAFYHRVRHFEPEVEAFAAYLEVSKAAISRFLTAMEKDKSQAALIMAPPMRPVQRGVSVDMIRRVTGVSPPEPPAVPPDLPNTEHTPSLPREVDLRSDMCVTRIKDQGMFRGTCVAHTGAAMMESELILKSRSEAGSGDRPRFNRRLNLSEQYLYWACKEVDGAPYQGGTFIEYAAKVLREGIPQKQLRPGICRESAWRYNELSIPGNESQGPIPRPALIADKYPAVKARRLKHASPKDLKKALASGHPVGLSVFTYHFWTDPFAWREGVISLPFRIRYDGAHAICLVGYRDSDSSNSDGYFTFKNSWGTSWGAGRPQDPGFGDLPYRYVLTEGIEAWVFEV